MTKYTKRGVPLTRNAETMTESQFFNMLRQAIRKLTMRWKPGQEYLKRFKRDNKSDNKRLKYEYMCEKCLSWLPRKDIELDHVTPCGSLTCFEDLVEFCRKAFIEVDGGWRVLCKSCHLVKTLKERSTDEVSK